MSYSRLIEISKGAASTQRRWLIFWWGYLVMLGVGSAAFLVWREWFSAGFYLGLAAFAVWRIKATKRWIAEWEAKADRYVHEMEAPRWN